LKEQSYPAPETDFLKAQLRGCAAAGDQERFAVLQNFLEMERKSKTNIRLDDAAPSTGRKLVGLPGAKVKLTLIKN